MIDAVPASVEWITGLVTGSVGTFAAMLAVAIYGFGMMRGEVSMRRGAQLVLGCFILFNAQAIAQGLYASATSSTGAETVPDNVPVPPPVVPSQPSPYDPYAGASAPI